MHPLVRSVCLLTVVSLIAPLSAAAQWSTSVTKDEMTGRDQVAVASPWATPTQPADFPSGLRARLAFACGVPGEELVSVVFSQLPSLVGEEPYNGGYSTITTRMKWDNVVEQTTFIQVQGDPFISFLDGDAAIAHMQKSSGALLELSWYGGTNVYFDFSLQGASAAITKARAACRRTTAH